MFDRELERAQEPTLPGFVAWLKTKDPNEQYHWPNSEICACGQYAKSLGINHWTQVYPKWKSLNILAGGSVGSEDYRVASNEWTFGKLLERAEAA